MSNNLLKERFEHLTVKRVAPVIPIWPKRTGDKRQKKASATKGERTVSALYYTEPIFKSKKHDFL
jgi:hypothetical protein